MPFDSGFNSSGTGYLSLAGSGAPSELMKILLMDAIDPGSTPGYQACKTIYAHHPLGSRMVDKPLQLAMSQEREISIIDAPEEDLMRAYRREWKTIGSIGANSIVFRSMQLSYIYGISTLCANVLKKDGEQEDPADIMPMDDLWDRDIYFNIYDPLNTAGSLVLNQDPYAVDFMHPKQVAVGSQVWNNTKSLVLMHEQPIWIEWSDSAFGFVGRSVYQRAFYPLKSFINAMIANDMIQSKIGLLVWKTKSPGSILDTVARAFKGDQRTVIKSAQTNNVLSIGETESLESLNLEHMATAGAYSRENILKDIATGAGLPAILLNEETLTKGFGEGTEDAKQLAHFVSLVRTECNPAFEFMDAIVQRRAWNPVFYKEIQRKFPERYRKMSYETAFQEWRDAFEAKWPNLLTEPDSDKVKVAQAKLESAVQVAQTILAAQPGREAVATTLEWLASSVNSEKDFYSDPLLLDTEAIAEYEPEVGAAPAGDDEDS